MDDLRITVLTSSSAAFPLISLLHDRQLLAGVLMLGGWDQEKLQMDAQLKQAGIAVHYAPPDDEDSALSALAAWQTTLGMVFCCGERIPLALARAPAYGMLNLHASRLPEYRGAQPIYWQIRNGETSTMLTAHLVDGGLDTGPVVAQLPIEIGPYDTHHCVFGKLYQQLPALLERIIEPLSQGQPLQGQPQQGSAVHKAPRVTEQTLLIDWRQASARQICDQVRAGSPQFGGARLMMGQGHAQLLQASPSELPTHHVAPGTLIHLSPERGLVVALKEESVRLDIIANAEGVFDGYRFAHIHGLAAGMRFQAPM